MDSFSTLSLPATLGNEEAQQTTVIATVAQPQESPSSSGTPVDSERPGAGKVRAFCIIA
uniref:Phb2.1.42 n=1 Tax=Coprinopsis cinerea TaxID=5346 RepID=Q9UVM7_COPCI|nr:Phb2.1.42 [Coprinopsis cinerea]